ncbi:DNA damage-regulated autophagy modulator protein 1 isoform X1 [Acipenser ruthenus]|uniref:DNA damage-regulated autophagy modulator protein 1 isoform X1 n=1 Tax=Acipenser ruthenus TaxID=7906 RepID=UPI002741A65F|nr:DNA damage-regulated autophagy modulator protein 1 isoform X1 [Acipenser ruthenus]
MFWFMEGMCFLPVSLVIWSSSSFIVSYITALLERHVDPVFPYISDTGTEPPDSGIFGVMITLASFLGVATMYTRYKFLEKLNETTHAISTKLNKSALFLGIIGCLGMCVVATFQETVITLVHDIGAIIAFLAGVIYISLQSIISFKMYPSGSTLIVCYIRMGISGISIIAVVPMIVCALMVPRTQLHWDPDEKDYPLHLVSAVCEWIVAFGFVCYFLTYIKEFQKFTLKTKAEFIDCY